MIDLAERLLNFRGAAVAASEQEVVAAEVQQIEAECQDEDDYYNQILLSNQGTSEGTGGT